MKKIVITEYQAGLVFEDGVYKKIIRAGTYWFWRKQVLVYEITKLFNAPVELNLLLKDQSFAEAIELIEVKDNELVLQYENGLLKQVLAAGRYVFWKSAINNEFFRADISQIEIAANIDRAMFQHRLLVPYVRSFNIESYEKGLLFVDGKFEQELNSGSYHWWKNNISIQVVRMDMRQQQLEINGQEILTKDKTSLRVNAWAQYQVIDLKKAVLENKEFDKQLYVSFQLALRSYIGGLIFDELLEKKDAVSPIVLQGMKEVALELGVEVKGFGIRDIVLPGDMKDIMNQVLMAEKKAQANAIMRREETASTRSLLNTAKLMEDNAMLWKLKEMEYVEKIADKISNISVTGNGALVEQLKEIFVPKK